MFAERESHVAYFLQEKNMTRFDAVNYISHAIPRAAGGSQAGRVRGSHSRAGLGEGVLGREWVFAGRWLLPTNRRAGQDGESGGRSTIRGRLAFMKAEFEISNA